MAAGSAITPRLQVSAADEGRPSLGRPLAREVCRAGLSLGLSLGLLLGLSLGLGLGLPSAALAQRALLPSQQAPAAAQTPDSSEKSPPQAKPSVSEALPPDLVERIEKLVLAHGSFGQNRVEVRVGSLRGGLPSCTGRPEPTLVSKNRPWGEFSVQVNCAAPQWSRAVGVVTRVFGNQIVSTNTLNSGALVKAGDIRVQAGAELTKAPSDQLTEAKQAIGKQLVKALPAGQPLRLTHLKEITVIKSGEGVLVQVIGQGFRAGGEGVALSSGGIGEGVRVRMPDGQQITATVVGPGTVELRVVP